MEAQFYFNKSDPEHISKNLELLGSADIKLKDETDILNPSLTLASNMDWVGQCNYIYIPALKRYYYVSNISSIRDGLWGVNCHVDVLMTYRPWILEQTGVIERQENKYNLLLADGRLKGYGNPIVQTLKFPKSFNEMGKSYILIGAGDSTN